MLELEIMINQLQKQHGKEKSIRKRLLLEKAIASLQEYDSIDKN